LWPELTHAEEQSLINTIHRFLPDVDCEKSDLFSGAGGLSDAFERLELLVEESQDENWQLQKDSIPPELKNP
jgi:hypothetical protein